MYREKLISQIEVFENAQKICEIIDIPELVELSDNILKLAKKVDELDGTTTFPLTLECDYDQILNRIKKMAEITRKSNFK